jgi:hypothetical protein
MRWTCVSDATGRDCNWVLARSLGRIVPGRDGSWEKYQQKDLVQAAGTSRMCITSILQSTCNTIDEVFGGKAAIIVNIDNTVNEFHSNNHKQHNFIKDWRQAIICKMSNDMSDDAFLD